MANYIPPSLDESSRVAIDDLYKSATAETPESIQNRILEGVSSSPGLIEQSALDKSLNPYGSEAMMQAIKNRSQRKYDQELSKIKTGAMKQSHITSMDRKVKAASLLAKEEQYNQMVKQAKIQAEQDRKQARAQVLGSILGIGGAVAGAYAGGPAGAMAGYQVGSGLGQTSGMME